MKWRNSVIYVVLFFVLGGYFYYFEVIQKEHKLAAEKESKKIFHFRTEEISSIEITSKDKKSVLLKKDDSWKILEPIKVDVDKASLDDMLVALSSLEKNREVEAAPADLEPFGLKNPALKIRFLEDKKWQEILLGNKNPTGDGYYAKTGDKPNVLLVGAGNWAALDKGVNDLRRRELLSFQMEDVKELHFVWQDGKTVDIEEVLGGEWKSPAKPEIKIKKSKVENVLEQIKWLRALKFLDNDVTKLESSGLKPALVAIKLQLKNGKAEEVSIGKKEKDSKQLIALSSELPAIVEVHGGFLDDLPKNLQALEDRSLFGIKSEDVKQVKWRLGQAEGDVVQLGQDSWGSKKDGGEPKALKESWHVRSLLWDVKGAEYIQKVEPAPKMPDHPYAALDFRSGDSSLVSMNWDKPSDNNVPVTVWMTRGANSEVVQVEAKVMNKIEQDLGQLLKPEDQRGKS